MYTRLGNKKDLLHLGRQGLLNAIYSTPSPSLQILLDQSKAGHVELLGPN